MALHKYVCLVILTIYTVLSVDVKSQAGKEVYSNNELSEDEETIFMDTIHKAQASIIILSNGHIFRERKKRSARAVLAGIRAIRRLLSRTRYKKEESTETISVFEKDGNYASALLDFFSVSPQNVKKLTSSSGSSEMFLTIGLVILVHSCSSLQQVQTRRQNNLHRQDRKFEDIDAVLSQSGPSYFAQEIPLPDTNLSDNAQIARRKRAFGALGSLTRAGVQFINFVLKGAKEVPTDKIMRKSYEKPGGIGKLKEDFNKYSPLAVRRFKLPGGGEGKAVKIGDRIAIMKTYGKSEKPSLEVFKATDIRRSQATGKSLADVDAIEITYID